MNKTSSWWHDF